MTTTIKSTELDFLTIKENLKTYLKATGEFNDYDFEGSGISSVLDVLAYNTHYNALQTNFALNESFLITAQLRPSVISLAESLGYVPDSKKSSQAVISVTANTVGINDLNDIQILQPGELVCRGSRDDFDYTFTNRVAIKATVVDEIYKFFPLASPDDQIIVHEGEQRKLQFIVGNAADAVYVIPDQDIDISTAIIKVYEDQASAITVDGEFSLYTSLLDASTVSSTSRLFVLRESPNAYYELSFGNGTSLGVAPSVGNVIEVDYLRASGAVSNGVESLSITSTIQFQNKLTNGLITIDPNIISTPTTVKSAGGGDKEGIESIRKNAPFQFAAQNRMVTSDDYSTLILKKYSSFIDDIQSWGGEDNPEPDYGTVFTSIVWKESLNSTTIANTRQGILSLADQFQIASFSLTFTDPVETFISTEIFFQFNPSLTGLSPASIRESVEKSVEEYFVENTGKFSQVFRQSNLLTDVDATDPSVLSSRANIILNRQIIPQLGTIRNYTVTFPAAIRDPELIETPSVYSSEFTFDGNTVAIRNVLNQQVASGVNDNGDVTFEIRPTNSLEVYEVATGDIKQPNVGEYNATTGTVTIESLNVQSIVGNNNYIKVFAVPANQSVVGSVRNNILKYDTEGSFTNAIIVSTR